MLTKKSSTQKEEYFIQIRSEGEEFHDLAWKGASGKITHALYDKAEAQTYISGALEFQKEHPDEVRQYEYQIIHRITKTEVSEEIVK